MSKGYDTWPGPDEDAVIDAMLADPDSPHWSRCQKLVERLVHQRTAGFPDDSKWEIIQNTMSRVARGLGAFKRESRLLTWLITVIGTCKTDELRRLKVIRSLPVVSLDESIRNEDDELEGIDPPAHMTIEEELMIREELREIIEEILKYLTEHGKQERNSEIIYLYLRGYKQQEIAKKLGIPAPNVGYIIRSIRQYLKKLAHPRPRR